MKRVMFIIILGILGIGLTAWATKPPELPPDVIIIRPLSTKDNPYQWEYDEMLSPTVRITTANGIGSGVVIQSSIVSKFNSSKETLEQLNNSTVELYVLTAAHVVGNYAKVDVTFYDYSHEGTKTLSASVVITDTVKDLALLSLKADNYNLKTAALADRDYQYYLFAPVYVVGCSLGLSPRPSSGIISAINFDSVEVSAPILPGNSGGPVYTADTHELIGIAVWVRLCGNQLVTTMAGIVPISEIYDFLDSATKTLRHQEKLSDFVPSWQINHRKELDYAESNVEFLAGCGQGGYQNRFGSHPEENRKIIATHRQLQALRGTVNSLAQLRIESVKNIATPLTCWKGLPIIRVSLKCNGAGEKHRSPPMSSRGALCLCGKRRM